MLAHLSLDISWLILIRPTGRLRSSNSGFFRVEKLDRPTCRPEHLVM